MLCDHTWSAWKRSIANHKEWFVVPTYHSKKISQHFYDMKDFSWTALSADEKSVNIQINM